MTPPIPVPYAPVRRPLAPPPKVRETKTRGVIGSLVLTLVLSGWPSGCSLDTSQKLACDNAGDCLDGYSCVNSICLRSSDPGNVFGPGPSFRPSNLRGNFSGITYTLQWQDNSSGETGFEVEERGPAQTEFTRVGEVGPNTTEFSLQFFSAGLYEFRVRAVVPSAQSADSDLLMEEYSESYQESVATAQLVPWDEAKVPTRPTGSGRMDSGYLIITWDPVDFRGDNPAKCGFRVYRRVGSLDRWVLQQALASDASSYREPRSTTLSWPYEYAVSAYNSFGESLYWEYAE